jgi:hypothetical protein
LNNASNLAFRPFHHFRSSKKTHAQHLRHQYVRIFNSLHKHWHDMRVTGHWISPAPSEAWQALHFLLRHKADARSLSSDQDICLKKVPLISLHRSMLSFRYGLGNVILSGASNCATGAHHLGKCYDRFMLGKHASRSILRHNSLIG